ncbi:MAG: heparinase II/III family protein [Armatimonadetes bacterium]|nr:heparinase II/III family protein [Armatimonadota bacterium]
MMHMSPGIGGLLFTLLPACLLTASAAPAEETVPDVRQLKVRSGHPILFVDADLVAQVRARTEDCRRFADTVKRYRMSKTDDPSDLAAIREQVKRYADWTHPGTYLSASMWYGTEACINRDELAVAYGRQYLQALIDNTVETARSPETHALGRVFALGALYDWLYDQLDDEMKHRTRLVVIETADALDTRWHFFNEGRWVGGHAACWANPYAIVGLIAIFTDIGQENAETRARYFELLGKVVRNIRDGIAPVHEWVCRDGGYHMGWDYGTCYTPMWQYLVWEFATDEPSLFKDWQNQHIYWYIYGLRHQTPLPDSSAREDFRRAYGYYPASGDTYGMSLSGAKSDNIVVPAFIYDNEHGKWLYNHFYRQSGGVFGLLYANFGADEGTPPDDLPLSRLFHNAGFAVMRDSWDFDANTLTVFKSSRFFSNNHHHRDQNSFTIYYRAPLAIDSGGYNLCGKYGSRHWYNYYTRSIAHNTVLIYDPNEDFGKCRWGPLSNDGGQVFVRPEAGRLEDIVPGGRCALDGIMRFEEQPDYSYVMGDATKAYSPDKVKLFQRHLVYLRGHSYDHPSIVIYDKVVSTDPTFRKTWLLHSIGKPDVDGSIFSVAGDDGLHPDKRGRLYDEVLLPLDAEITVIGGVANDQEFYVADDGTGRPHNYREEWAEEHPEEAAQPAIERRYGSFRELGEWRVEVSPEAARLDDRFLNVLSVTDDDGRALPVRTEYTALEFFDAVAVIDNDGRESTLVLFLRDEGNFSREYLPPTPCRNILIVGLEPGRSVTLARLQDGRTVLEPAEPNAPRSLAVSDEGTVYAELIP